MNPEPDAAKVDEKLDNFIAAHSREHTAMELTIARHEMSSVQHPNIEQRLRNLEDFQLQTRTLVMMVKVIFGASILAAITGVLSLITMIEHLAN